MGTIAQTAGVVHVQLLFVHKRQEDYPWRRPSTPGRNCQPYALRPPPLDENGVGENNEYESLYLAGIPARGMRPRS
ncbi:hypothetical protein F5144DRAFT_478227 [Chaetomium tenue]|uniref:Uncharacterized protein n=1 Tax=Chaetomium tenue TaxID=1854479 RepID=A0ACB7PNA8_9PEZI|nr:hypothetical protein F5144DRAFT_478227 [Chaetomium globosum]